MRRTLRGAPGFHRRHGAPGFHRIHGAGEGSFSRKLRIRTRRGWPSIPISGVWVRQARRQAKTTTDEFGQQREKEEKQFGEEGRRWESRSRVRRPGHPCCWKLKTAAKLKRAIHVVGSGGDGRTCGDHCVQGASASGRHSGMIGRPCRGGEVLTRDVGGRMGGRRSADRLSPWDCYAYLLSFKAPPIYRRTNKIRGV